MAESREPGGSPRPADRPRPPWIWASVLLGGLAGSWALAGDLNRPDCTALEQWAGRPAEGEPVRLAPKVELSPRFADERVVPLFGHGVESWTRTDLNTVRRWLNQCRRAALKRREQVTGRQLYDTMKAVAAAGRPLGLADRYRQNADRAVDSLLRYRLSSELPRALALARQALQGQDVVAQARTLRQSGSLAAVVANLRQATDYVPASRLQPLIARLAEREQAAEAELQAVNAELDAARRELARTPGTRAGLKTLDRLQGLPVLRKIPTAEANAIQQAIQQRRLAIDRELRQHAARRAAAEAARPVDIEPRLTALLTGQSLQDAAVGGLRPGMDADLAARHVRQHWRFLPDVNNSFKTGWRERRELLRTQRRDGGKFELGSFESKVGQIRFIEHYTGPVNANATRAWLVARLGKPGKEQAVPFGRMMMWSDGGSHLQVKVSTRIVGPAQARRYQGELSFALWSDDYEAYLAATRKRCDELKQVPMNQLSFNQRQQLVECMLK